MSRLRSSFQYCSVIVAIAILLCVAPTVTHANPANTSDDVPIVEVLGDFRLEIEACGKDGRAVISGQDGVLQLVVTANRTDSSQRDVTRGVVYTAEPADVVQIDSSGHATPLQEGTATIHASLNGQSDSIQVEVKHIDVDLPINFSNDVVPLFTKNGCNGGGCHGKASGQNGFKLSLLGFEPKEDFEFLIKEGRGRRLFPAAPDRSLLLQKAIGSVPHGGGARLEFDSPPYRVIRRWISQGMPYGSESDPKVARIEVFPKTRTMQAGASQQLMVTATYTDGSVRDVTRMTRLESNEAEMAAVTPSGLVETQKQTGTVAVMAMFAGHVDVFRATLPLGDRNRQAAQIE